MKPEDLMKPQTIETMMAQLLEWNPGQFRKMEKVFNNISDSELKKISSDKENANLPAMRKEIKRVLVKLKQGVENKN